MENTNDTTADGTQGRNRPREEDEQVGQVRISKKSRPRKMAGKAQREIISGGVYKITHIPSGEFYIGATRDFVMREESHRSALAHNAKCYKNKRLGARFRPFNPEEFLFSIVETCPLQTRFQREFYWIKKLAPALNGSIAAAKWTYKVIQKTNNGFGDNLRNHRARLNMTQRQLAKKARISVGFLCDVENGKRSVSADTLMSLSDVFNVSMDKLFRD